MKTEATSGDTHGIQTTDPGGQQLGNVDRNSVPFHKFRSGSKERRSLPASRIGWGTGFSASSNLMCRVFVAAVAILILASPTVSRADSLPNREIEAQLLFADGSPAANMELGVGILKAKSTDGESRHCSYSEMKTDGDGRFRLKLPESGSFEVVVDAWSEDDRKNKLYYEIWPSKPQAVSSEDTKISLRIDNTHNTKVVVRLSNPFPQSLPLQVHCKRTTHYQGLRRTVQSATTSSAGGEVEFSSLTPGKYEVTVAVDKWPKFTWTRKFEIAENESSGPPKPLAFHLPALTFGSVKGSVAMEDGTRLESNNSIQMQIHTIGGYIRFDVHSGQFELHGIPSGPIRIASNIYQVAGDTQATVFAEKTASVGKTLLKPRSFGKAANRREVSGVLKFDDGTSIEGARLGLQLGGGFGQRIAQATTDEKGRFAYEMYATHSHVRFNLSRSKTWLNASNKPMPQWPQAFADEDFYARIKPGQEDQTGFNPTLPHPSKGYGDIEIEFKNFEPWRREFAVLRVITSDGEYRAETNQWQDDSLKFKSVPPGKREIICATMPIIGLHPKLNKTSGAESIVVDALDSGQISIVPDRSVHDIFVQVQNLSDPPQGLWASEDLLNEGRTHLMSGPSEVYNFQWTPSPWWSRLVNVPRLQSLDDRGTTVDPDGTIHPPRFAPARYRLRLGRLGTDKPSGWVEFDLKKGDELRFEFPVNEDGTPGTPKRKP